ncbi:MAG: hypothetical protein ACPKPY_08335 [Nitrososphaeraceae archaeon]
MKSLANCLTEELYSNQFQTSPEDTRRLVFEDEIIVTQKPYIRKSMSFECEQQKIRHNGSRDSLCTYP